MIRKFLCVLLCLSQITAYAATNGVYFKGGASLKSMYWEWSHDLDKTNSLGAKITPLVEGSYRKNNVEGSLSILWDYRVSALGLDGKCQYNVIRNIKGYPLDFYSGGGLWTILGGVKNGIIITHGAKGVGLVTGFKYHFKSYPRHTMDVSLNGYIDVKDSRCSFTLIKIAYGYNLFPSKA